jgi:hypothetical protein
VLSNPLRAFKGGSFGKFNDVVIKAITAGLVIDVGT